MKILVLANFDLGLYQFRRELIYELLKDNEVYIALPYGALVELFKNVGCVFIDTPMERRGLNPFKDLRLINQYFKIIKEIKPELVISYTVKPNVYGGLVCRIRHVSFAANITGLGTAFEENKLLREFVTQLYKIGLKKAKVVFFENSYNRDFFINKSIVEEKKTCLLSGAGVNLERFCYIDYPENKEFHFLFVGRVMKEKGIEEILAVMKRLVSEKNACCLDVVGPFEEDYEELLKQYEEAGWLKYYGFQEDVRPFIAACDCFVLPSWHEGMANTNLECAASGRPIITSNIPGCREAVIESVSGLLCDPKNTDSLYEKMKIMIQMSRTDREIMGIAGRKQMQNVFDKKIVVRDTLKALGIDANC